MGKNPLILTTFLLTKRLCEKKKCISHLSSQLSQFPLEIVYGQIFIVPAHTLLILEGLLQALRYTPH